jgi:hypothetical protein
VISERGFELRGHEANVPSCFEEVIKTRKKPVARSVFEDESLSDAAAERTQIGSAQSIDEADISGQDETKQPSRVELPCWPTYAVRPARN